MAATILAVDDIPAMLELLKITLSKEGYIVRTAETATQAFEEIQKEVPDLILLDIMLPDMSGTQLTAKLKNTPQFANIPIVLVTAKDSDSDVVVGLKMGADDYITKPFKADVLTARVEAILRRYHPTGVIGQEMLACGAIRVLPQSHQVYADNESVEMTQAEFIILQTLIKSNPLIVSRQELLTILANGGEPDVSERVVDTHVASIRKKLGNSRKYIRTVHGRGYKMVKNV